jgi:hypothetical protein
VERDELADQLVATWRRHNEILLFLVRSVPPAGFAAVPLKLDSFWNELARRFINSILMM